MAQNDAYKGQLLIKGSSLSTIWPWRLVVFSLALFAATLVIYAGLIWGYRPYLEEQVFLKDTEIAQLAEIVPEEEQMRFLEFYGQLLSLEQILNNHVASSRVFTWLEEHTNARIFFSSLDLNVPNQTVTLEGIADSFDVLAEQLELFRQSPDLEKFFLNQSQRGGDGRVVFRLELIFHSSMFTT